MVKMDMKKANDLLGRLDRPNPWELMQRVQTDKNQEESSMPLPLPDWITDLFKKRNSPKKEDRDVQKLLEDNDEEVELGDEVTLFGSKYRLRKRKKDNRRKEGDGDDEKDQEQQQTEANETANAAVKSSLDDKKDSSSNNLRKKQTESSRKKEAEGRFSVSVNSSSFHSLYSSYLSREWLMVHCVTCIHRFSSLTNNNL